MLSIEKLSVKEGEKVVFDKVLLIDTGTTTKVGTPYLEGATVEATLTAQGRGKKLLVQKFKSKSRYTRRVGHRQAFSKVTIEKAA